VVLWIVLGLGALFVLAIDAPLLLLGLVVGFGSGIVVVWRNPWGLFLFMRPDLEDPADTLSPGKEAPVPNPGSHNVTINLANADSVPVVRQPCRHCGTMVDIVQNSACPKCGAPLK
jgi:hypothetical protein